MLDDDEDERVGHHRWTRSDSGRGGHSEKCNKRHWGLVFSLGAWRRRGDHILEALGTGIYGKGSNPVLGSGPVGGEISMVVSTDKRSNRRKPEAANSSMCADCCGCQGEALGSVATSQVVPSAALLAARLVSLLVLVLGGFWITWRSRDLPLCLPDWSYVASTAYFAVRKELASNPVSARVQNFRTYIFSSFSLSPSSLFSPSFSSQTTKLSALFAA